MVTTLYSGTKPLTRYGHTVVDNTDPYVRLVSEASRSTSEAALPGAFLVDLLPSRTILPCRQSVLCSNVFSS